MILTIKAIYKYVYIRWQKHVLSYVPIRKVMGRFKHFISPVLGCLPHILLVHAQNQSGNDNLILAILVLFFGFLIKDGTRISILRGNK